MRAFSATQRHARGVTMLGSRATGARRQYVRSRGTLHGQGGGRAHPRFPSHRQRMSLCRSRRQESVASRNLRLHTHQQTGTGQSEACARGTEERGSATRGGAAGRWPAGRVLARASGGRGAPAECGGAPGSTMPAPTLWLLEPHCNASMLNAVCSCACGECAGRACDMQSPNFHASETDDRERLSRGQGRRG